MELISVYQKLLALFAATLSCEKNFLYLFNGSPDLSILKFPKLHLIQGRIDGKEGYRKSHRQKNCEFGIL